MKDKGVKNTAQNKKSPSLPVVPFRWKPGQSGNPNGRPKKEPITERYRQALEIKLPDEIRITLGMRKGSTVGDALARKMVIKAINGSIDAAREITDRVEGKAPQAIRFEGDALLPAPIFNIYFGREQSDNTIDNEDALQIPGHTERGDSHDGRQQLHCGISGRRI
jgi:hypothetical protein